RLPDLGTRAFFWLSAWGYRVKVTGVNNLPGSGPVLLATNAGTAWQWLEILSATDREVHLVPAPRAPADLGGWYGYLTRGASLAVLRPGDPDSDDWERLLRRAVNVLEAGGVLAVSVDPARNNPAAERFYEGLQEEMRTNLGVNIVPAYWGDD